MDEHTVVAGLGRLLAVEERDRLKLTHGTGVVDWGERRRAASRYEAYWRGMSIGVFPSAEDARAYLHSLG
jgi:hypothetical protein